MQEIFFFFLLIQVSSDPCMKNTAYIKLVIKLLMNCFEHLLSLSVITAMLMYTCLSCWVIAQEVVGEGIQFLWMCTTGSAYLFFFFLKWTYSTEIVLTVSVLVFHHIYVLKPCSKVFWHAFCKLAYMTIKYEECCLLFPFFHIASAGSPEPTALNTAMMQLSLTRALATTSTHYD